MEDFVFTPSSIKPEILDVVMAHVKSDLSRYEEVDLYNRKYNAIERILNPNIMTPINQAEWLEIRLKSALEHCPEAFNNNNVDILKLVGNHLFQPKSLDVILKNPQLANVIIKDNNPLKFPDKLQHILDIDAIRGPNDGPQLEKTKSFFKYFLEKSNGSVSPGFLYSVLEFGNSGSQGGLLPWIFEKTLEKQSDLALIHPPEGCTLLETLFLNSTRFETTDFTAIAKTLLIHADDLRTQALSQNFRNEEAIWTVQLKNNATFADFVSKYKDRESKYQALHEVLEEAHKKSGSSSGATRFFKRHA